MASARMLVLLLALVAPLALANDLPTGGCKSCASGGVLAYAQVPSPRPAGISSYFRFGLASSGGATTGFSGNTNYEYLYTTAAQSGAKGKSIVDNLLPDSALPVGIDGIGSHADCCAACAKTPGCLYYVFYPGSPETLTGFFPTKGGAVVTAAGQPADGQGSLSFQTGVVSSLPAGISHRCNLLKKYQGYYVPSMYSFQPTSSNGAAQAANPKAILGGTCNPTIADDPHLVGARGTKFDFNGALHQPYCLITDTDMHINVLLDGYEAAANASAAKATRTWIKEVGLVWRHEGVEHSAHLVARGGKQQERGSGFLRSLVVDGAEVPIPAVGRSATAAGGFRIALVSVEKKHIFDVDHFSVSAGKMLEMDVRMRVAHPNLQTPDDAQAHFNLGFDSIQDSPSIHGVLGQTYRTTADQVDRAARFQALAKSLNGPLFADGANGRGFLDGETSDYVSSSVLSPDCKFSAFHAVADDDDNSITSSFILTA